MRFLLALALALAFAGTGLTALSLAFIDGPERVVFTLANVLCVVTAVFCAEVLRRIRTPR